MWLPHVEAGSVPTSPALFFGDGSVRTKSAALLSVSSQESRAVGLVPAPVQMSSRRESASPKMSPMRNGAPTPSEAPV